MRLLFALCVIFSTTSLTAMLPSEGFKELKKGNKRFLQSKSQHPRKDQMRRKETSSGQEPFAIIVACSDSRVAPEILFDQGIGDLFVIRLAGNVVTPDVMESIKYAANHLHSCCVLVVGHQNCGAVDAVVQAEKNHEEAGDIPFIAQVIRPSVVRAMQTETPGQESKLDHAIKLNASAMSNFIKHFPSIQTLIKNGNLDVQAAYYDFSSGEVNFLD